MIALIVLTWIAGIIAALAAIAAVILAIGIPLAPGSTQAQRAEWSRALNIAGITAIAALMLVVVFVYAQAAVA